MIGNPTKVKEKLGWQPSVTFKELVQLMVNADLINLSLPTPDGSNENDNLPLRRNFATIVD